MCSYHTQKLVLGKMGLFIVLQFLCSLLFLFSSVESHARLVPALYVFGDSVLDAGNNNYLDTPAKANYSPYGVDFPGGATGRFTNGHTIADFLVERLGTSIPPPYLALDSLKSVNVDGFNYASGSAGILHETGSVVGKNLNMGKQVKLFEKTIKEYLPLYIKGANKLSTHLSKSIFMVLVGSNDYLNNFLLPEYNSSRKYNPLQFTDLLVNELERHLQKLYNLGARKFVLGEVGPMGCMPGMVNVAKPKTTCVDDLNNLALTFNMKLAVRIDKLRSKFPNSNFVITNTYKLLYDLVENPSRYGMSDSKNACCVVTNNGPCTPNTKTCLDRNQHVFWDSFHPSEASNKIAASMCFNGTGLCTPMNVLQLTQIP